MNEAAWADLEAALTGAPVSVFLRDDDAIAVTAALARLDTLCVASGAPLLLAAIPAGAGPDLGAWTAARRYVTPCQHGYAHRNHAAPGARACEIGGDRDDAEVFDDLMRGRAAMDRVFGRSWAPILVPPWNRIRESLVPGLAALGYVALSAFAGPAAPVAGLLRLDCDLDIIDWRHGRRGRDDGDLCRRLAALIDTARAARRPIGVLCHHLVHDAACWSFLERLLPLLRRHPGARLVSAAEALDRRS